MRSELVIDGAHRDRISAVMSWSSKTALSRACILELIA